VTDPGSASPISASSFGQVLKYLRLRARLTQRDLAQAVGYSPSQISRLEGDQRPPDLITLAARFVPALNLDDEPALAGQFLQLAARARGEPAPDGATPAGVGLGWTAAGVGAPFQGRLPVWLTTFIGREQEIGDVRRLLGASRLVTLTGSGGVGKTRLSVQAAEAALGDFSDGVWLVELAPLSEPEQVAQQVAASLRLRDEPGRPVLERLTDHLRARRALLLLDNCEHLLEACAGLADALLRDCRQVCILATSREALGIDGEVVYRVPSLAFPDPDQAPTVEAVRDSVAVRLFVDRAR